MNYSTHRVGPLPGPLPSDGRGKGNVGDGRWKMEDKGCLTLSGSKVLWAALPWVGTHGYSRLSASRTPISDLRSPISDLRSSIFHLPASIFDIPSPIFHLPPNA